jgi:hypothetical protein
MTRLSTTTLVNSQHREKKRADDCTKMEHVFIPTQQSLAIQMRQEVSKASES